MLKKTTLDPTVFAFLRDVVASMLLLTGAYIYENRQEKPKFWVERVDTGHFVLNGLLMVWGAQGMSALAIANLTPVFFAMTQPGQPVMALTLSWALGGWRSFRRAVVIVL